MLTCELQASCTASTVMACECRRWAWECGLMEPARVARSHHPGWARTIAQCCRDGSASPMLRWSACVPMESYEREYGMTFAEITYEEDGPVGTLTLNRPKRGNMFTERMCHEARDWINAGRRETRTPGLGLQGRGDPCLRS